ncbi:MAG TPA: hypothetical protein VFM95_08515, partial [Microcella sp.]|nr:hypothetical protein [Microcella sp.]
MTAVARASERARARPKPGPAGREATPVARTRPPLALVAAALVAASAAAIPLVYLVVRASETGAATIIQTLTRGRVLEYAANSLTLALASTAAALVLGTAVAVVLTRIRVPFPRTLLLISALPLAVPSYLAGY